MLDSLLTNGRLYTPEGIIDGWLGSKDGVIAALGTGATPNTRESINLHGAIVLPGGIDPHVHFRDPGATYKEDFATGTAAAAAGGVTTIFDMPNTIPAVTTPEAFAAKRAMAETKANVDFGLFAAVDPDNLDQIAALASCGAIAFKIFMYERPHPPPRAILDDGILWEAFRRISATGRVVCVHAENEDLLRKFAARGMGEGNGTPAGYLSSRPALIEAEAITRASILASDAGVHLHICHLSSAAGVEQVRMAKHRGAQLSAETGPQQMLLNVDDHSGLGGKLKMAPPVRTAKDGVALWRALRDGTIDMVATDHAPHTAEEKGASDWKKVASGIIGVETALPLLLTKVAAKELTLDRLVQVRSENPARRFGLYPRKGVIRVGSDADLVVVDAERRWTITGKKLHSRSRMTPFEGWQVQGAVVMTLLRGIVVYKEGTAQGDPSGRMVRVMEGDNGR